MRIIFPFLILFLSSITISAQIGANLFNDQIIHEIRLSSTNPAIFNELVNHHENYLFSNGDKMYSALSIEIDGTPLGDDVGVRLKGETSYTQVSTDKKPFKIDINRFAAEQTYDGLKKFNLHNARSDASMIRDKICYDLFRAIGLNAPRVAFAKVYLNDEYWGLYSIVEQVDKTYLEHNFGNKNGNLYKSSSGGSINFDNMELKTNEAANDFSLLNELKDIIANSSDAEFETLVGQKFNLTAFLGMLAVDVLVLDIDKFWQAGKNYYLYENTATGKTEWIPWDYNLAMNYILDGSSLDPDYKAFVDNPIFDDKTLIRRIMANDNLRQAYLQQLCQLKEHFNTTSLFDKINAIQELIQADVLADTKKPYTNEEFLGNINTTSFEDYSLPNPIPGIQAFITERSQALDDYLDQISFTCTTSTRTHRTTTDISVFPNPVSAGQFVYLQTQSNVNEMLLFNASGQKVAYLQVKNNSFKLPTTLAQGLYFYKANEHSGKLIIH